MVQLVNRYSNALLSLMAEDNDISNDLEQVTFVRDTLDHREIREFLENPDIPHAEKKNLVKQNFGEQINHHLMGFLDLMIRRSRESLIIPVLTDLIHQINKKLGKIEASVVSAIPLSQEEEQTIAKILSEKLDSDVSVKTSVDPELVAGFYVQIEGQVFDSSLRTDLSRIKDQLKKGEFRDS